MEQHKGNDVPGCLRCLNHSANAGSGTSSGGGAAKAYTEQAINAAAQKARTAAGAPTLIAVTSLVVREGTFVPPIPHGGVVSRAIRLPGVVPCGTCCEPKFDAKLCILAVNLTRKHDLGFCAGSSPERDGNSEGHNSQQDDQSTVPCRFTEPRPCGSEVGPGFGSCDRAQQGHAPLPKIWVCSTRRGVQHDIFQLRNGQARGQAGAD